MLSLSLAHMSLIPYSSPAYSLSLLDKMSFFYVAAKASYIRLLHGKIGFLFFFGLSSVKRGQTHIVLG